MSKLSFEITKTISIDEAIQCKMIDHDSAKLVRPLASSASLARFCKEIDFQYRYLVQRLHFAPTRDQIILKINYNNNNHPIISNHGT